jgi:hypothetical protein
MSTAAQTKYVPGGGGYEVGRPLGKCTLCAKDIEPETKFMAALLETPTGFQRLDLCPACWPNYQRKDVLAFWQTVMPPGEQKKKLFVDDNVLCELFERLSEATEPAKVNFRFVLGLILMRKRLLVYESTRMDGQREIWTVRMKGRQDMLDLFNPRLDEQQVKDVSLQLSEILQQEL